MKRDERSHNKQNAPDDLPLPGPSLHEADSHKEDQEKETDGQANKTGQKRRVPLYQRWKQTALNNQMMVVFTLVIALANLCYAVFGAWQLSVMRSQLKQMHLASRAWVGLAKGSPGSIVAGEKIEFELTFINTGETPANRVQTSYAILVDKPDCDIESFVGSRKSKAVAAVPSQRTIAPNAVIVVRGSLDKGISEAMASEIQAGRMVVYIFGEVAYDDIEGARHTTRYCATVDPSVQQLRGYKQYNRME